MMGADPIGIALFLAALSLLPLLLIVSTSFLKTVIVLLIVRNALGVQQVPPSMALYAIAMAMTAFVMAPTFHTIAQGVDKSRAHGGAQASIVETVGKVAEPLRGFMLKHASEEQRELFLDKARSLWPEQQARQATSRDFVILIPSFVISEMQAGFYMGFLIFIPFLVIDLIVSNLLLALGMQMVSPTTVSLPLKLFLFVIVDGWSKLLHAILNTYL
ncbi:type III secretion system export apparatus subunit SctR [Noviherbaspirillum saxi]|uniref:EscR/YscR/HrcR family type III secretion system export apparatus protein n=1 Tax=Noviherbaspirillum saxi TaxID=2320863 RepID=A0A3A3FKY2_9BURK|nr:type III secretion system export apparatus subunit SctR [Noviherbaspirillum saxi]RJF92172.1 EscR/YscR/HrcR family type III secretion system export apparatus protein [Noviherbaspirillum saxi]